MIKYTIIVCLAASKKVEQHLVPLLQKQQLLDLFCICQYQELQIGLTFVGLQLMNKYLYIKHQLYYMLTESMKNQTLYVMEELTIFRLILLFKLVGIVDTSFLDATYAIVDLHLVVNAGLVLSYLEVNVYFAQQVVLLALLLQLVVLVRLVIKELEVLMGYVWQLQVLLGVFKSNGMVIMEMGLEDLMHV